MIIIPVTRFNNNYLDSVKNEDNYYSFTNTKEELKNIEEKNFIGAVLIPIEKFDYEFFNKSDNLILRNELSNSFFIDNYEKYLFLIDHLNLSNIFVWGCNVDTDVYKENVMNSHQHRIIKYNDNPADTSSFL